MSQKVFEGDLNLLLYSLCLKYYLLYNLAIGENMLIFLTALEPHAAESLGESF